MEARYYVLGELEERMSTLPSISALIVKENHRQQFPDYQEVNSSDGTDTLEGLVI